MIVTRKYALTVFSFHLKNEEIYLENNPQFWDIKNMHTFNYTKTNIILTD